MKFPATEHNFWPSTRGERRGFDTIMKSTNDFPDAQVGASSIFKLREEDWEGASGSFGKCRLASGIEIMQGGDGRAHRRIGQKASRALRTPGLPVGLRELPARLLRTKNHSTGPAPARRLSAKRSGFRIGGISLAAKPFRSFRLDLH